MVQSGSSAYPASATSYIHRSNRSPCGPARQRERRQALQQPLAVAGPALAGPQLRRQGAAQHQGDILGQVVSIPQGHPEKTALNLSGPILINHEARLGLQVPQMEGLYPTQLFIHKQGEENKAE